LLQASSSSSRGPISSSFTLLLLLLGVVVDIGLVAGRDAFPRSTLPANTTADLALAPMNGPGRRHYYAWEGLCTACAHDNDYVNHVRHRWHREAATREAISLIEHISHQCYTASMTTTRNGPVRIEAASAARRYLLLSINSLLGQLAKHQDPRDYTVMADAAVSHHASPS
jgi:hypothetical protein